MIAALSLRRQTRRRDRAVTTPVPLLPTLIQRHPHRINAAWDEGGYGLSPGAFAPQRIWIGYVLIIEGYGIPAVPFSVSSGPACPCNSVARVEIGVTNPRQH